MKTYDDHPNFSVVVPSGCNAKCDFCWWQKSKSAGKDRFLSDLKEILSRLPEQFQRASITGGEPTLCSWLPEIAEVLATRFNKIVLTTNGTNDKILKASLKWVKHVTLSRHYWTDEENELIFKTDTVPNTNKITELCFVCNKAGVDVSMSAILPLNSRTRGSGQLRYLDNFTDYAKQVGASSLQFRKISTSVPLKNLHALERNLRTQSVPIQDDNCIVCRSTRYIHKGLPVIFKASAYEPSKHMKNGLIYELIYQQNGTLTSDWGGKDIISEFTDESIEDALAHIRVPDVEMVETVPKKKKKKKMQPGEASRYIPTYRQPAPGPVNSGGGCGAPSSGIGSGGGCG